MGERDILCCPASLCALSRSPRGRRRRQLAEVATRVPNGVFCLLTALRFHGLGTQNPREVWVAVDRRAGIPRVDFTPVRTIRISGAALTDGIEEHNIEGVRVRVTSASLTLCCSKN